MGKKKIKLISGILALAMSAGALFSGCSLIRTNSAKDMKRTVAEIDISKTEAFQKEFKDKSEYFDAIGSTSVIKRELITYYVSVGYSYMNQYNWDLKTTFNNLVTMLANNAVLTQYATMHLLSVKTESEGNAVLDKFRELSGKGHKEYEKYEYLLGEDSDDVKIAKYALMSSINSAIDSVEKDILKEKNSTSGTDKRTTPSNIDTEQDDYYPKKKNANGEYVTEDGTVIKDDAEVKNYVLDYDIYTGYEINSLENSGTYKDDRDEFLKKESNTDTRLRAYSRYISSLSNFNLIDVSSENLQDVHSLTYVEGDYVSQLKARVINKYYDMYEDEQLQKLLEGDTSHLDTVYKELYDFQADSYKTESAFSTALGEMSDSSLILYSPKTKEGGTFGLVYNILLPFSTSQSLSLTALQSAYKDDEVDSGYNAKYYIKRNELLKNITTTDQRKAWFNGETEYAFDATGKVNGYYGASDWLFFENNLTDTDRYKAIDKYIGKYSYNGTVVKKADGKYEFGKANTLTIDEMLKEFSGYVNYVLNGGTSNAVTFDGNYNSTTWQPNGYYENTDFYKEDKNDDKQEQIDYSKLVYASGKVNVQTDRGSALDKDTDQYKAMAAVNELQYAYTTDTGVLSQYLGYTVDAGKTSYIKEFEHAAHQAVNNGEGSFIVCAGDYGWHLIYVTYTFDIARDAEGNQLGGEVYASPDWSKVTKEGTFEYMFYEWIKNNDIKNISTGRQSEILNKYSLEDVTVEKYEKAYKNLLNLG